MVRPATRLAPRGARMDRRSGDGDPLNFAKTARVHDEKACTRSQRAVLATSRISWPRATVRLLCACYAPAMRLHCEPSPRTRLSPDALLLVCTADYRGHKTGLEHCVSEIR